jgi:hypothetical protein
VINAYKYKQKAKNLKQNRTSTFELLSLMFLRAFVKKVLTGVVLSGATGCVFARDTDQKGWIVVAGVGTVLL